MYRQDRFFQTAEPAQQVKYHRGDLLVGQEMAQVVTIKPRIHYLVISNPTDNMNNRLTQGMYQLLELDVETPDFDLRNHKPWSFLQAPLLVEDAQNYAHLALLDLGSSLPADLSQVSGFQLLAAAPQLRPFYRNSELFASDDLRKYEEL